MSNHRFIAASVAADPVFAKAHARTVFRRGAARIDLLVAEMGGWATLPAQFKTNGPTWNQAEDAISEAAADGHWWSVVALGEEYLGRIDEFCAGWRRQMEKRKTQGGSR